LPLAKADYKISFLAFNNFFGQFIIIRKPESIARNVALKANGGDGIVALE